MTNSLLTPAQAAVLHENTRLAHNSVIYSAYVDGIRRLTRISLQLAAAVSSEDYDGSYTPGEFLELATKHQPMPYAELPFLFRGKLTAPGTFVLNICRVQLQTGEIIDGSKVMIGTKGVPDSRLEGVPIPEDFPMGMGEFASEGLRIALSRLNAQLTVGLPNTVSNDPEEIKLVETWPDWDMPPRAG